MLIELGELSYYSSIGVMLVRGTLYQLIRLQFRGWILLGRSATIQGLSHIKINGVIKIGAYSQLDARFSEGIELGNKFSLGDYSIIRASGSRNFKSAGIKIGKNVSFGPYSNIGGGYGLTIGDDCIFGPYVSIHPEGHTFSDIDIPIRQQGINGVGIVIESDNWFGAKCTVLDGAKISSGCVFGAQTLMIKGEYSDNRIYVGSPAKVVRFRFKS
jgi:acetyltransferase-like isoleucine patch superfamily enzyme